MRSPILLVSGVDPEARIISVWARLALTSFYQTQMLTVGAWNMNSFLVSAVTGCDQPALRLTGDFLKVDWLWMTFMVGFFFFSGKFTSRYQIKFPGLRIMEFGMCPDLQMHWTLCESWNTSLQALPFTCEALTYIWVLSTASCSLTQE